MFPAEPDRIDALAHVTDHVAAGVSLLTREWSTKPRIRAVLASYLRRVQDVEDAAWDLAMVSLDNAVGAHLNQLGVFLGEPRQSLDDEPLRTLLRARILANRSHGTGPELGAILAVLAGGATTADYALDEFFPAAVKGTLEAPATAIPPLRSGAVFRRAVSGGVGHVLVALPGDGTPFRFASGDTPESPSGGGFGDVADSTRRNGGRLVGAY